MKSVSRSDHPALATLGGETRIVYDGDCPFCARYVAWQRLRESVGAVQLHNARDGGELVEALWAAGYDLDNGMVLLWRGQIFYGDECLNRLALLSSASGLFNRLNARLFSSPRVSAVAYPVLRAGRNLVLRLLRRKPLTR